MGNSKKIEKQRVLIRRLKAELNSYKTKFNSTKSLIEKEKKKFDFELAALRKKVLNLRNGNKTIKKLKEKLIKKGKESERLRVEKMELERKLNKVRQKERKSSRKKKKFRIHPKLDKLKPKNIFINEDMKKIYG